jgi:hypothetical protein
MSFTASGGVSPARDEKTDREKKQSMKRVLVVNPWVADFKLYDEWMHPVGLYFLLSLLKHNGIETAFINCLDRDDSTRTKRFGCGDFPAVDFPKPSLYHAVPRKYKRYGIGTEQFIERCRAIAPVECICIGTSMTYWIDGVREAVKLCRECFPATPILLGGIAVRLMPDFYRQAFPATHLSTESIIDSSSLTLPGGLRLSTASWTPSIADGIGMERHVFHGPVLATLGCPHSCSYCASSILQPRFRLRPVRLVADEIEYMHERFGARQYAFYDDALLYRPERCCIPLLHELISRNVDVAFHVPNGLHIRWITPEIGSLMKQAGFVTLRFGYESTGERFQSDISSKASRRQASDAIATVSSCGFSKKDIGVYVMGGFFNQAPAEMIEEMRFIGSLGVLVKPVFYSPVPGTAMFRKYAARFPALRSDPYRHNDHYFTAHLPGWGVETIASIRTTARRLNQRVS